MRAGPRQWILFVPITMVQGPLVKASLTDQAAEFQLCAFAELGAKANDIHDKEKAEGWVTSELCLLF